ncbi:tetratricopeptide repeat protein [Streptomyces sp. FXY-T5]|uniref:tetratricopeptide repeat protein n=1 Tax=Streptomyces sp. FXY-T5 TaxID=3064901 RepID=UPI0027D24003|nr:tetratricopeptide repeat protein [Streptomyces sp. FXY-T5]WMD09394.1 tetratricopeptide repeat protein [Streptomyces sp. FXY-T5]
MAQARPSMQELIRQRGRAGFVGRSAERAAFRANFGTGPDDERHRFRFHVHGNAGVGKTFLLRELEQIARERGALTAYVDDGAGSVPEAMAEISRQFAAQGRRLKELDRLLAAHRERRHEAELAALDVLGTQPEEAGPSTGGRMVARAGVVAAGMVPVVGPFAGMLDAEQLARVADRLRASLVARFRNHEDLQLVLSPEQVLTPVLLRELSDADAPWIALFLDTYERTGPYLDPWLHETMTTDRHGGVPATTVVATAGRTPLDPSRWGGLADFVTDLPLAPFTDTEARGLLAAKGVTAEPVVEEVLRLTGGLPVLVSTLAEARPTDPDDVGDPSATAVERFLKWEEDPVRRATALSCALPRWLDGDVFRAVAECPEGDLESVWAWLRGMPFVTDRTGERLRYHDVVRAPMLRAERRRSPRGWAQRHRRLAEHFGRWREETGAGRGTRGPWADGTWRELRLEETYHLLCAGEPDALPQALRDFVQACDTGASAAGRWARALVDAGTDADAEATARWGTELTTALDTEGIGAALGLLLRRADLDTRTQARARVVRGDELRGAGAHAQALTEYGRAIALDPESAVAHRNRAGIRGDMGDHDGAIADLDRAVALEPDNAWSIALRGEHHRIAGRDAEAIRDLTEAIRLDPALEFAWASRGATHGRAGDPDAALADLGRALDLDPDYAWAFARRARVWRALGDPRRRLADLDRALALSPDWPWARCERGDALRVAGRDEEAVADLDIALSLDPVYTSAYASRGESLARLGRHAEALADLNRAVEMRPAYVWALCRRALLHAAMGRQEEARADVERVRALDPEAASSLVSELP